MHATTLLTLAIASLAVAQTGESGCVQALDNIVNTCLAGEQSKVNNCEPNDWDCMCENQELVVRCYNDCPSDPRRSAEESKQVQYCDAAEQYGASALASQSAAAGNSTGGSSAQATSATVTETRQTTAMVTGMTGTASAAAASETEAEASEGGAAALKPVGVLAAVFGIAAAAL
ncbi:hypothetical protein MBLNU230_g1607t1 [Neophaeotheca triangularis]